MIIKTAIFAGVIVAMTAEGIGPLKLKGIAEISAAPFGERQEEAMAESVYKIIELVGTSTESWEKAAKAAVDRASQSLRDLRIAEISQLDI